MRDPVQVTFHNMSAHEALSEAVRSRAHWLETFDPDVAGCRVALEFPHRHKKHGRPFNDAFDIARRRLEDAARRRRGD